MLRAFSDEIWIAQPREKVFEFFSNAANLDAITPAWLDFKIITPMPVEMHAGTLLEYRLKLKGIPIRWLTEIMEWDPPRRFVDRQLKGPYRKWIHTHMFEVKDGGTMVKDQVLYEIPGWIFEPLMHRFFVGPDIKRIFEHRHKELKKRFE
jgi:ligand-binding SRPBCC domain-containing protein